jgi:hypothetical protein
VVAAYDSILARERGGALAPRAWFTRHSGQVNAALALEAFLQVTQGRARLDAAEGDVAQRLRKVAAPRGAQRGGAVAAAKGIQQHARERRAGVRRVDGK